MALQGTLQDMSISDLLEVFQEDHKSGQLHVTSRHARAELTVDDGEIISALLFMQTGSTPLYSGSEVTTRLLTWQDGEFLFEPFVAKRVVHSQAHKAPLPSPGPSEADLVVILEPVAAPSETYCTVHISLDEWYLLSACIHNASLSGAASSTGISFQHALSLAKGLAQRGLISLRSRHIAMAYQPPSRLLQAVMRRVRAL
jgi:hypothetical protein